MAAGELASERKTGTLSALTVVAWIVVGAALTFVLAGRWDEFTGALGKASLLVVLAAVALQVVALVARTEAWDASVRAAGGTMGRRCLYRASSMGYIGGILNGSLSSAARITALRRSAPRESPRVPALIAAEFPILAVEATLAALTSFTLVGPLGLPWWTPVLCLAATVGISAGLRRLALAKGRDVWKGLAVLRSRGGGARLVGFVLIAVFAQIARNWLVLHAVGVDASVFDAIAVLIALVSLGQLPIGPTVGAAAAVLILGPHGVAAAAAAGVLLTATGTIGGLGFAGWAGLDRLWCGFRRLRPTRAATGLAATLAALPAATRRQVERSYFGGLSHIQIARALNVPAAA
jgi:uncharacterized membrane protein YbhN (UPF0104 family)